MIYTSNIQHLQHTTSRFFEDEYSTTIQPNDIIVNVIAKDIQGDYSVVLFPFLKRFQTNPNELGAKIADYMKAKNTSVSSHEVIKGFLNLTMSNAIWTERLTAMLVEGEDYGRQAKNDNTVVVEFCSPNTNKPLHLGHIRNILIGWSASQILDFAGNTVKKVQIINDRGIAICKSMLAWLKFGEGSTPSSTETKGDHFVGNYYVMFEQKFKAEYAEWQESHEGKNAYSEHGKGKEPIEAFYKRFKNQYFNSASEIGEEARNLLLKWEEGDKETIDLWKTMNQWVYDGFEITYDQLGVNFDKLYFESDTYILGKKMVQEGLEDGKFYKKEDGSIWVDLEQYKLDHKILLRSDGTSVYITQDIGTAIQRHKDFGFNKSVYVVADEQDYHFQALFATMKTIGFDFSDQLYHLSYGMVDLPTGKMKSREGTVVDADDLVVEVVAEAAEAAKDSHNLVDIPTDEKESIFRDIGLGALKYFILKVQPKKRMTFDPSQSVDMQGQTGPYIQNAYVRIASILSKVDLSDMILSTVYTWQPQEVNLLILLDQFGKQVSDSAKDLDPSNIAHYVYDLAKEYHKFYHDHRILTAESEEAKAARLLLSNKVAQTLKKSMYLLGINMPEKM